MVGKREDIRFWSGADRSRLRPGPWDNEPFDKVQWKDVGTGYICLAVRNTFGCWCGYVGVPPDHAWYGIGYMNCSRPECTQGFCGHEPVNLIDIHGGITFSDWSYHGSSFATSISHEPVEGIPDQPWWFGFDTSHAGDRIPDQTFQYTDGYPYRDMNFMRDQIAYLALQLKSYEKGDVDLAWLLEAGLDNRA